MFTEELPERLIGDKAYDSDPLDEKLAENGVELIAPHRSNRKKEKTQDGRKLRRYRRRWKVERLFAWLQNYRRILVRFDRIVENYIGFVHLGCLVILLDARGVTSCGGCLLDAHAPLMINQAVNRNCDKLKSVSLSSP
jgi:transposase